MSDGVNLLGMVADYGGIGLLALYLAAAARRGETKMDGLVEKFQAQISELETKRDADEERLRVRYDQTIEKLDEERRAIQEGMATAITEGMAEMRAHCKVKK